MWPLLSSRSSSRSPRAARSSDTHKDAPRCRSRAPSVGAARTFNGSRTIRRALSPSVLLPRFRFHADEAYLPVHPLFVLETAGKERPQGPGAAQALGAPVDRIRRYLALTLAEKAAKAKIFYDVYRDERPGPGRIVAEYWLYYVESRYRTQRGFFPFSLDTSHPNDLEHVFLILAPRAGSFSDNDDPSTGLVIERIVAGVHDGRVPNHVTPISAGARLAERPLLLVELGSHSLAPDVDGDGNVPRTSISSPDASRGACAIPVASGRGDHPTTHKSRRACLDDLDTGRSARRGRRSNLRARSDSFDRRGLSQPGARSYPRGVGISRPGESVQAAVRQERGVRLPCVDLRRAPTTVTPVAC